MTVDPSTLPLADNGMAASAENKTAQKSSWSRWFLVPLLMGTLFTGAVIGMYFQPPGLRVFFRYCHVDDG